MSEYLPKIQKYCDYQERYQQEVRDKLYSWGVKTEEVEHLIAYLIEHDYINEERYAKAFVRGKFRIKHWGRNKIRMELKQRKISDYCIKEGLKEIQDTDYLETLKQVLNKRKIALKPDGIIIITNDVVSHIANNNVHCRGVLHTPSSDIVSNVHRGVCNTRVVGRNPSFFFDIEKQVRISSTELDN